MKIFRLLLEAAFALMAVIAVSNFVQYSTDDLLRGPYQRDATIILRLKDDPKSTSMSDSEVIVSNAWLHLEGFAPANQSINLSVNGADKGFPLYVGERARFETSVTLRDGLNEIVASLDKEPDEFGIYDPETIWKIRYQSDSPRRPILIFAERGESAQDRHAIGDYQYFLWGLGEPDANIEVCYTSGGITQRENVSTDALGAFRLDHRSFDVLNAVVFGKTTYESSALTTGYYADAEPVKAPASEQVAAGGDDTLPCDVALYGEQVLAPWPNNKLQAFSRKLEIIENSEGRYTISAEITVPQQTTIADWAEEGLVSSQELTARVFNVSGFSDVTETQRSTAQLGVINVVADGDNTVATVTVSFQANINELDFRYGFGSLPKFLSLAGDQLIIAPRDADGIDTNIVPDNYENGTIFWQGPQANGDNMWIRVQPQELPAQKTGDRQHQLDQVTRQTSPVAAINRLVAWMPNILRNLGVWVLLAIPFFWFIRILHDSRSAIPESFLRGAIALTTTLLVLHFAYALIWIPQVDLYSIMVLLTPEELELGGIQYITRAVPQLAIGASVCCASLIVGLEVSQGKDSSRQNGVWICARLLILLPTAAIVLLSIGLSESLRDDLQDIPIWIGGVTLLLIAVVLEWAFIHWLLRTVLRTPLPGRIALFTALGLILLPSMPLYVKALTTSLQSKSLDWDISPYLWPTGLDDFVWSIILTLVGGRLLWVLFKSALLLGNVPLPSVGKRRAIAAIFFLTALPLNFLVGDSLSAWTYLPFFHQISSILPYVLLFPAYHYLRHISPDDDFKVTTADIALGAMLFAFYLCGQSTNLLLIPIPLLLGWYLYRRHMLVELAASGAGLAKAKQQTETIDKLLNVKEARRLQNAYSKHGEKAYTAGKLTRGDYENGLDLAKARVESAKQTLNMEEKEARQVIFSHGPEDGRWSNARSSVLHSIPLVILFQLGRINQVFSDEYQRSYPLFDIVSPLLRSTFLWLISAFLFGYLFHLIKGRNGMEKALAFSAALVLPALVVILLNEQPLFGEYAGDRTLRIVLFVFYLGFFAFDLRTLHRYNHGMRELVAVYGLGSMIAFVSSLVALGSVSILPILTALIPTVLRLFGVQ